jgi:hypothetical protein
MLSSPVAEHDHVRPGQPSRATAEEFLRLRDLIIAGRAQPGRIRACIRIICRILPQVKRTGSDEMNTHRIAVDCPDDEGLIHAILDAGASAGAGIVGNYSRVAMIFRGTGTWKSESGATPHLGEVGSISVEPSVRIEMQCPEDSMDDVEAAWRKVHPYEEPVIESFPIMARVAGVR